MTPRELASADPDELLTEDEAADLLKVSNRTLQAWRCNNSGPPFARVGRSIRYSRSRLKGWLSSRTVQR
jgi:excisionase family DNA binding protein